MKDCATCLAQHLQLGIQEKGACCGIIIKTMPSNMAAWCNRVSKGIVAVRGWG